MQSLETVRFMVRLDRVLCFAQFGISLQKMCFCAFIHLIFYGSTFFYGFFAVLSAKSFPKKRSSFRYVPRICILHWRLGALLLFYFKSIFLSYIDIILYKYIYFFPNQFYSFYFPFQIFMTYQYVVIYFLYVVYIRVFLVTYATTLHFNQRMHFLLTPYLFCFQKNQQHVQIQVYRVPVELLQYLLLIDLAKFSNLVESVGFFTGNIVRKPLHSTMILSFIRP